VEDPLTDPSGLGADMTQEQLFYGYMIGSGTRLADAEDAIVLRSNSPIQGPSTFSLGSLQMSAFSCDEAVDVVPYRTRPVSGVVLGLVLDGEVTLSQAGRSAVLAPGQFTFYEGSRPFHVSADGPHSYLAVLIPLFKIGLQLVDVAGMVATDLSSMRTSASLLSTSLTTLAAGQATLPMRSRLHVADAVLSLIHAVVTDEQVGPGAPRGLALFNLLAQWVEQHLADAQLDTERVAAAHHLSARYVRQVFSQHGTTVSRFIRERRLEHARADLANPACATHNISTIARRWHFDEPSVFSRNFRDQYGESPNAYRRTHTVR
jgi:AraC-like DNA-binding protein